MTVPVSSPRTGVILLLSRAASVPHDAPARRAAENPFVKADFAVRNVGTKSPSY
jgi:hypothetical protein